MITAELVEFHQLRALFLAEQEFAFVVGNPAHKGESVIYITNDPELGKLDLIIANNSASAIVAGSESLLRIYASPPLAEPDVKRIKLATQNWKLTLGEDCLELRCSSQITIPSRGTLTIPFLDVMASGEATTGFFVFEYSGFKGIRDDSRRATVFVQRPPKGEPPPLAFDTGVRPEYAGQQSRTVYVTPWAITATKAGIANHIVLLAGNARADAPIKSSPTSDPKIVLSFTSGNSDLSLCSDEQIKVAAAQTAQGPPWRIERDNTGPVPVWTMRPPQGAANVFDAGGLISVRFDGIVSRLPPNFASPMFIQFANIPGYNDGYGAFFLQKIGPAPFIKSFEAYAGSRKLGKGAVVGYKEKITLTWDVFGAESCRIAELGQELSPAQSLDVFPANSNVTYTLTPQLGREPSQELKKTIPLAVSPPTAQLSAALTPPTSVQAMLQWNCSNGSHCTLRSGEATWDNQPLVGSLNTTLMSGQTFTITCLGAGSASASARVEVPPVEAMLRVDCRSGYLHATVTWSARWAESCEVSEPGFRTFSRAMSGDWCDSFFDDPPHFPENHTSLNPFQPRWVRHFQIVAKRTNTVIKDVYVSSLNPVAEA
jgi:hypothetical protein